MRNRPNWCPHKETCRFIFNRQDKICGGKMKETKSHDGDWNTHHFCLDERDLESIGKIVTYEINKTDVYHFIVVLEKIRETM